VKTHIRPKAKNEREGDEEFYVSFVSAPITVFEADADRKIGVLVLTSDLPGRFDEDNSKVVEHLAEVLAQFFFYFSIASDSAVAM
jgi:signal transduction protein with GAF and PtsI domain